MVRTELFREKCNDSDFLLTLKNGFRSKKMKTCIIISRSDEISLFIMSRARDKENWKHRVNLPYSLNIRLPRTVTKISVCPVNTTSRRGIKQLGISIDSVFLLISYESSRGNPRPPPLNDSPGLPRGQRGEKSETKENPSLSSHPTPFPPPFPSPWLDAQFTTPLPVGALTTEWRRNSWNLWCFGLLCSVHTRIRADSC